MTKGSRYQSRQFTIDYFQGLALGGSWLGSLDLDVQSWKHSTSAFGGFDTAEFTLIGSQDTLDDWIRSGLGRPIVVSDDTLSTVWEGFVNSITINQGGLSVTRGPVTQIANRVFSIYSGVDVSVYPPVVGVRKKSPTVNDTASQSLWGIWPKIVSLAGVTDDNVDRLISMYLQEHASPDKDQDFSFGSESLTVTVSCVGWYQLFNFPYNNTLATLTGMINLSDAIITLLISEPNGWLTLDSGGITVNTTQVPSYANEDRLALEYLRGYAAMGDSALQRYLFGIFEDRKIVYGPVSNQIDYTTELGDPQRRVFDANHALVSPWRLRPGKWVFYNDFMPSLGAPFSNLREDPRAIQIEAVDFDLRIPTEVHFNGGKSSEYEQRSAQLGLRGTSV